MPPEDERKSRRGRDDAVEKERKQTGAQATWAAFFDDRFDKLEPVAKLLAVIAAILYVFKKPAAQRWTINRWNEGRELVQVLFRLLRERNSPFSTWIRQHLVAPLRRWRQGQQDAIARERTARQCYWGGDLFIRNRRIPCLGLGWFFRNLRDLFGINPGL